MTDDTITTADDILTSAEAAEILDKSPQAMMALLRRGVVRGRKIGRPARWVTTRYEVQEYAAWARTHNQFERRRHHLTGRMKGDL